MTEDASDGSEDDLPDGAEAAAIAQPPPAPAAEPAGLRA
jgi:hypothetical protein